MQKFLRIRNPIIAAQGRLTTLSGTAVLVADRLAQTLMRYTPYNGDFAPLVNAAGNIDLVTFAEVSNDSTATSVGSAGPAVVANNSIYDFFLWLNTSTGLVTLTRGPLWSNDTTRSAGTALLRKQGMWVNAVAITNGPGVGLGTYVGSARSNGSAQWDVLFGQSSGSGGQAWFGIWNMYNRTDARFRVQDSTASYTYSSATIRSANNSATNRVSFLSGLAEDAVQARVSALCTMSAAVAMRAIIGVALDSTTVIDYAHQTTNNVAVAEDRTLIAIGDYMPQLGFHFVQAMERGDGTNNMTFTASSSAQGLSGIWRW